VKVGFLARIGYHKQYSHPQDGLHDVCLPFKT
jgi:hypothetical protein